MLSSLFMQREAVKAAEMECCRTWLEVEVWYVRLCDSDILVKPSVTTSADMYSDLWPSRRVTGSLLCVMATTEVMKYSEKFLQWWLKRVLYSFSILLSPFSDLVEHLLVFLFISGLLQYCSYSISWYCSSVHCAVSCSVLPDLDTFTFHILFYSVTVVLLTMYCSPCHYSTMTIPFRLFRWCFLEAIPWRLIFWWWRRVVCWPAIVMWEEASEHLFIPPTPCCCVLFHVLGHWCI